MPAFTDYPLLRKTPLPKLFQTVLTGAFVFTLSMAATGCAANEISSFSFDEASPSSVRDSVTGRTGPITAIRGGNAPEYVSGISGAALRVEGWSSWATFNPGLVNQNQAELTVEGWVAVRNYPTDQDAAIINQHELPDGFFLGLDRFGMWNFSAGVDGTWQAVFAPDPMPRYDWMHVAGSITSDGMRLYLNGNKVAENLFPVTEFRARPDRELIVGRRNEGGQTQGYATGAFNGLIDEFRIHDVALDDSEIASIYSSVSVPEAEILATETRYNTDPYRPRIHPMQPSAWTNEPHGMVFWNDRYHVFYQSNPNGLYLGSSQQWGHIVSDDLATWEFETEVLWPSQTADQNGVWSGSTIDQGNRVVALYTANDGGQAMSVAYSDHPNLEEFEKSNLNAVIGIVPPDAVDGITGHRDPFVFEANGFTYVIIGGGYPDRGIGFLYRATNNDLTEWDYRGEIFSQPFTVAGMTWEMPQFIEIEEDIWVFFVNTLPDARSLYWIGRFENERFLPDHGPLLSDMASGVPTVPEDNRFFHLSPSLAIDDQNRWWGVGVIIEDRVEADRRVSGYANALSLPRIYELHPDGDKLRQTPPVELQTLRDPGLSLEQFEVESSDNGLIENIEGDSFEVSLSVDVSRANNFFLDVRKTPDGDEFTRIRYSRFTNDILIERGNSSNANTVGLWDVEGRHDLDPGLENLELQIFVDRSIITIFANERTVLTTRIYPTRGDANFLEFGTIGGSATVESFEFWPLEGGGRVVSATTGSDRWKTY